MDIYQGEDRGRPQSGQTENAEDWLFRGIIFIYILYCIVNQLQRSIRI